MYVEHFNGLQFENGVWVAIEMNRSLVVNKQRKMRKLLTNNDYCLR